MRRQHGRDGRRRLGTPAAAAILVAVLACTLASCTQPPEPEETIESLTSVVDPAETSSAVQEFSIENRPEPIVEPLPCTPYLVITARGTSEPSKGQLLSPVARTISESRPDQVQTLDIDYPADDDVNGGGALGVRLLVDTLNVQTTTCYTQRFVLLGYSQGALIIGDALVDPEHRLVGAESGDLIQASKERVLAIVLYGNPRFDPTEPYDAGTFKRGRAGLLPRPQGSLEFFADRMRDYCAAEDFVCQSNGFELDPEGHMAYYGNGMQQDGAAFVILRLDPLVQGQDEPPEQDESAEPASDA